MSKRRIGGGSGNVIGVGNGNKRTQTPKFRLMPKLRQLAKKSPDLAIELINSWNLVKILILIEVAINYLIIKHVNYTEIDWSTYMVQVSKIFNHTKPNFDYTQIEGPTGPLVYPAGHTYVFYILKELTEGGKNILTAQYLYLGIYIAQLFLVYKIYSHKRSVKVPPYIFLILCLTSKRIHSIYVLRLFNDPIAVLFAYASFYALLMKRHSISAFLFSFAISIKMNILLYAPAYALVYYEDCGLQKSVKYALVAMTTQLLLAAPYLYANPIGYFERAFNFGRVFLYQWTVNWRFLDEKTFVSPTFFKILLGLHLVLLFLIFWSRWLNIILPKRFAFTTRRDDPILTLFIANFIGIACSRSLHYQFYIWYYHSIPILLWATKYSVMMKLLIFGCIEFAWESYPSTTFSSLLLHASHMILFIGLITRHWKIFNTPIQPTSSKSKSKRR